MFPAACGNGLGMKLIIRRRRETLILGKCGSKTGTDVYLQGTASCSPCCKGSSGTSTRVSLFIQGLFAKGLWNLLSPMPGTLGIYEGKSPRWLQDMMRD